MVRTMAITRFLPSLPKCLLVAAAVQLVPVAHACVTVKVYNDSDHKVVAHWEAGGCGGVKGDGELLVCKTHTFQPRSGSESYDFKWGTTGQIVDFKFKGIGKGEGLNVNVPYSYHTHDTPHYRRCAWNCFGGTPGSCGRHYTVHITNDMIASDSDWYYDNLVGTQNEH